ncbi:uncharacterized protein STEHIDRAFT_132734 [Stereum hirsutum FP-91666 SS1]|uniref:uncharacterized protein n=1 Tax=Stereum hirsutum (strain FP-91666) TaxID=721885 RepID=UPI000444A029|nr:uncharacterized protein STEHIDRAFT_132734 [Stereum hirsutum FP-91666 SS1]EIM84373.1 hypothetical protein STEHIDRAFT_132734 [Stereum hirsutum FP-91666 SS1]
MGLRGVRLRFSKCLVASSRSFVVHAGPVGPSTFHTTHPRCPTSTWPSKDIWHTKSLHRADRESGIGCQWSNIKDSVVHGRIMHWLSSVWHTFGHDVEPCSLSTPMEAPYYLA